MPRGPRLDAPGVLHHVIARGIEGASIFRDHSDCEDFLKRIAGLVDSGAVTVYAFALVRNHFHLLVRSGIETLSRSMRRLLSGYANRFNRRHQRAGHLLQNRFKSIVCDEEIYFLELVRYIHLNRLRAGLVDDPGALDADPYCGQSAILGLRPRAWLDSDFVLAQFGPTPPDARRRYREFVVAGANQGRRPELVGGGLVRSVSGWQSVPSIRMAREAFAHDERILGSSGFVESVRREAEAAVMQKHRRPCGMSLTELLERIATVADVDVTALHTSNRGERACRAREGAAYLWIEVLGRRSLDLALVLGAHDKSIYRLARRGRRDQAMWSGLVLREGD